MGDFFQCNVTLSGYSQGSGEKIPEILLDFGYPVTKDLYFTIWGYDEDEEDPADEDTYWYYTMIFEWQSRWSKERLDLEFHPNGIFLLESFPCAVYGRRWHLIDRIKDLLEPPPPPPWGGGPAPKLSELKENLQPIRQCYWDIVPDAINIKNLNISILWVFLVVK